MTKSELDFTKQRFDGYSLCGGHNRRMGVYHPLACTLEEAIPIHNNWTVSKPIRIHVRGINSIGWSATRTDRKHILGWFEPNNPKERLVVACAKWRDCPVAAARNVVASIGYKRKDGQVVWVDYGAWMERGTITNIETGQTKLLVVALTDDIAGGW
jgi:hypothetical protein